MKDLREMFFRALKSFQVAEFVVTNCESAKEQKKKQQPIYPASTQLRHKARLLYCKNYYGFCFSVKKTCFLFTKSIKLAKSLKNVMTLTKQL